MRALSRTNAVCAPSPCFGPIWSFPRSTGYPPACWGEESGPACLWGSGASRCHPACWGVRHSEPILTEAEGEESTRTGFCRSVSAPTSCRTWLVRAGRRDVPPWNFPSAASYCTTSLLLIELWPSVLRAGVSGVLQVVFAPVAQKDRAAVS